MGQLYYLTIEGVGWHANANGPAQRRPVILHKRVAAATCVNVFDFRRRGNKIVFISGEFEIQKGVQVK